MKRRLKNFELFKESYYGGGMANELEDSIMPEEGLGELGDDMDMDMDMDLGEEGLDSEDLDLGEEDLDDEMGDDDEDSELKAQVKTIIDDNYSDTIKDMVTGILGELDSDGDVQELKDAILDILDDKAEAALEGDESDDDEEEGLDLDDSDDESDDEEGEELDLDDSDEEGEELESE